MYAHRVEYVFGEITVACTNVDRIMFPDAGIREEVTVEQPRLPLACYQEQVPVPAGWDDHPCGYLLFGPPYDAQAREAQRRGWAVRSLPGAHLHQTVDPAGVARVLLELATLR